MSLSVTPAPPEPTKTEDLGKPGSHSPQEDPSGIINLIEPTIVFKVRRALQAASLDLEGVDMSIQIQNTLFGISRSEVMKSGFFRGMLESPHLGDSKEGSLENPITFDSRTGIVPEDLKSLLNVMDIRAYEKRLPPLSQTQWASAYRLARMWEFDQLRDYIHKNLDDAIKDPLPRIECADLFGFENWIVPALAQLCQRDNPLTPEEGARLGIFRFAEVCKQRERNRSRYNPSDYESWIDRSVVLKGSE
ncbi:hypothetical protein FRC04_004848 [Tulasnella sp. 424]|nr:hypothetical protein FRC04_004848 [Tulasnella sp. 424]KAG8963591.1 hypothetical protein FRC05_004600 [Tulasnella sp. 425]